MTNNLRSYDRMNPSETVAIVHGLGPEATSAAIIDESFSGLGIAVPIKLNLGHGLSVGMELSIEYSKVRSTAVVRHLSELPSGCRLGVQWKAEALSQVFLELLSAVANEDDRNIARLLPGGLSNMWKMYEAEQWGRLVSCGDRLRQEAAADGATELIEPTKAFQDKVSTSIAVGGGPAQVSASVGAALNEFIRTCAEVVSARCQ